MEVPSKCSVFGVRRRATKRGRVYMVIVSIALIIYPSKAQIAMKEIILDL